VEGEAVAVSVDVRGMARELVFEAALISYGSSVR